MSNKYEQAEALCNAISAKLPLVDSDDLSILADIMQSLDHLAADPALPEALKNQAKRTTLLTEKMIMNETPFDSGLNKLAQSIEKMVKGLNDVDGNDPQEENQKPETEPQSVIPDDLKEMIIKFASQQLPVLEDFEALCLDFEKNELEARGGIKRMLHTWKGEFGVLDQQEYSKLIHRFEEKLEEKDFAAESLFRLKDFLTEKLQRFAEGEIPGISKSEQDYLYDTQEKGSSTVSEKKRTKSNSKMESSAKGDKKEESSEKPENETRTAPDQIFNGDPSLLADFVAEAREHLDSAEPLLLELENNPMDAENLNTIFRACHTIKGVAGFLGFTDINHLSHSMENLLDLARKEEIILMAVHIDVLLQGMDCLRELNNTVEGLLSNEPYGVPDSFAEVCKKLSSPLTLGDVPEPSNKKMGEILVERGEAKPKEIEAAVQKQEEGDSRKVGEILMQDNLDLVVGTDFFVGPAAIDLEVFTELTDDDDAKASGYYAGFGYSITDDIEAAVRYDGLSEDLFSDLEHRIGLGATFGFKYGIYCALEYGYTGIGTDDGAHEIALQLGLEQSLKLPGYQRKTLTQK